MATENYTSEIANAQAEAVAYSAIEVEEKRAAMIAAGAEWFIVTYEIASDLDADIDLGVEEVLAFSPEGAAGYLLQTSSVSSIVGVVSKYGAEEL